MTNQLTTDPNANSIKRKHPDADGTLYSRAHRVQRMQPKWRRKADFLSRTGSAGQGGI
jgi:hypothetical protein